MSGKPPAEDGDKDVHGSNVVGGRARIDRRVLRTRDILGDALVELMQEKDFDDISVQEVLDRAGVGRSTFYAHYSDKHDLLLSDVEDFFEMLSTMLERHRADAARLAPIREFFSHIRDARQFYAALVNSGKVEDVLALGRGYFARSIADRLKHSGIPISASERTLQGHALAGSMFALLDWWIAGGMKQDPAELDALFHRLAWSGVKGSAER